MVFESVRGYVELASGLTDLTRARARSAAHGLLILPVAGIATGTKVAAQAGALADELLSTAVANRSDLRTLVRSEVDVAITRLGLVPAQKLEDSQAEAARLRAEVARLRLGSSTATAHKAASPKAASPKAASRQAASAKVASPKAVPAKRRAARAAPVKAARTATRTAQVSTPARSAVSTRARPAGA